MAVLSGATYLAGLLLAGAVALFMAAIAARHRDRRGALAFGILMSCFVVWSGAEALALVTTNLLLARVARAVMFTAIPYVPVALFFLSLQYTGRSQLVSRTMVGLLCLLPTVTVVFVATNPFHHLMWTPQGFLSAGRYSIYDVDSNVWFWVHTAYSYLLLTAGSYLFVKRALGQRGTYRAQSRSILIGIAVPWAANLVTLFGPWDLPYDLTPIFFTISGVFLGVAVLRFQFLDLVPVARDSVVEVMRDAVLVVDDEGRVVDVNPKACELLGADRAAIVGDHLTAVAPQSLVAACLQSSGTASVSFEDGPRERIFDIRRSALPVEGQVILLYDVTEQRTQAARLEHQNERLERFASVLSHDLRNPLNVAQGYVDLLESNGERSEYISRIDDALDRMETLVDDTLELTHEGQVVAAPEPVSIAAVAERAWDTVVTGSATLEVETDLVVPGDDDRLQRLFENLFRNSVEHGSSNEQRSSGDGAERGFADGGPTVRVEDVEEGFAVHDDGPGIPSDERETVFEFGFSTSETGTGLGLAIVAEIAEAHGWEVRLADTETGARFEFAGVDSVERSWPEGSDRRREQGPSTV